MEITKRRICWPNPDATCLEGGCTYCNNSNYHSLNVIRRYAETPGLMVCNRGDGKKQFAVIAYNRGWSNLWYGRIDYK